MRTRITTQRQVDDAAPRPGPYALGHNLYLNVEPSGSKQWQFIWKVGGRKRYAGLGSAGGNRGHKVSLVEARRKANAYRVQVAGGLDPRQEAAKETTLFGDYADTVIGRIRSGFRSAKTYENWKRSLKEHAKPLAMKPVAAITATDIAAVLRPFEARRETHRQLRYRLEIVFRHARADGLRDGENPASREALGTAKQSKKHVRHHPAMPYEDVPAFFASLDNNTKGHLGLKLLLLSACRTGEVLGAERSEFDFERMLWTIPASRVKNGADHVVPLTPDMLAVLQDILAALPATATRLFPDATARTLYDALKKHSMGAGLTVHGFRSSFRDYCGNETPFARDIVEETYGHTVGDSTEAAYRRRKALRKRRQVLNHWNAYVAGRIALMDDSDDDALPLAAYHY